MGGNEEGCPLTGELIKEANDPAGGFGIQISRRFIGKDDLRGISDSTGNGDPLLFASGQFFSPGGIFSGQVELVEQFSGPLLNEGFGTVDYFHGNSDIVRHGPVGEEFEILVGHADLAAQEMDVSMRQFGNIDSRNIDHALGRLFHAADQPEQGRFSGAAHSGEKNGFPSVDGEGDIRNGLDIGRVDFAHFDKIYYGVGIVCFLVHRFATAVVE